MGIRKGEPRLSSATLIGQAEGGVEQYQTMVRVDPAEGHVEKEDREDHGDRRDHAL